jgi:hypothetical protein
VSRTFLLRIGRRDGEEVAHDVQLGEFHVAREVRFVRARYAYRVAVDGESFRGVWFGHESRLLLFGVGCGLYRFASGEVEGQNGDVVTLAEVACEAGDVCGGLGA